MSKTISIKDWYGTTIRALTWDETAKQLSGVKVPETVPGNFTFYFSDSSSEDLYLRYYVKGYSGGGAQQQFLRIDYPAGETTYLQDLTVDFNLYIMTTTPSPNHISFSINNNLWHTYYDGNIEKIYISSGYNPTVKLETSQMDLEYVLPLNNEYEIFGLALSSSATTPDIYPDTVTTMSIASGQHLYMLFTTVPTDAIFMTLYNNTAPSNRCDKSGNLTQIEELGGILRKQCSVSSPIITIYHDGKPDANYVYIPSFKRYYYITDIVNIATDLWELYLKSDVLMSFKSEYLNSRVTVLRSASSSLYNRLYRDTLMPIESALTRTRTYFSGNPLNPNFTSTDGRIVLTVFSDPDEQQYIPSALAHPQTGIDYFGYYYPRGVTSFAIDRANLTTLAKIFSNGGPQVGSDVLSEIFGTDDLSPYIVSLRAYPINFRALLNDVAFRKYTVGTQTNPSMVVPCGKITLQREIDGTPEAVAGYPLIPVYPALDFGTLTVPTPTSFIDTDSVSKAILHLPYIGDINFNLTEYAGLTLKIVYLLDILTGNVKALIQNNADNKILYSQTGKMGVDIPMILNNMIKGESERTGQAIKLGTSVASVVAGAVGTAVGSPVVGGLVAGGVSMLGNTIATPYFNTPAQNKQLASGDMTEFMTDQKCYLEVLKPTDGYSLFYAMEYGIPSNKIVNLSSYTGTGYAMVSPASRITCPADATLDEYNEICSALKSGVEI